MKQHRKLDSLGVSAFCESMAMMVQAGIQTDEAVELLRQGSVPGGVLETGLKEMRAKTEEGMNLADAMEASGMFPAYAIKMIRAGEDSGRLEDVLFRLGDYYADQETIMQKLSNSVTYPAAMLILIVAVLAVMIAKVLPTFGGVYRNMVGSLTSSASGYILWAYGFCVVALVIMVTLAVALIGGLIMWNSSKRPVVESVLWKIPICASILETMGLYRFTAALATFLASGEMQDLAVLQSAEMVDCKKVEEKIKRCCLKMEEGHSIAQAAYDEELFQPIYGRMLLAGDRSGNLEGVLQRLTRLLEEHCGDMVDRLVGIIDPLLSGVLMVTVAMSLISVMLPLIGMMSSIG